MQYAQDTNLYSKIHLTSVQDLLASLGAKFGSALADIFQNEFLRILAERISDGGLTPATDTVLLLTAYRSGSHFTSDIKTQGTLWMNPCVSWALKLLFICRLYADSYD